MIKAKRPCRVCKRWFRPNPRVGDRQMTCGNQQCQREWHRSKCAKWNKENHDYFKGNYLKKKISAISENKQNQQVQGRIPLSRFHLGLPRQEIQEVIGLKQLVITEYIIQLLIRRFQEFIKAKLIVNTG